MSSLFHLKNLSCAYRRADGSTTPPVLTVEQLELPIGKMVILLGKSGAGKSTILETLGLMNNTLSPESELLFSPNDKEQYRFEKIWANPQIADIRKRHFSFIFQNTNLMPNFTVYENICLTQMIQGTSYKDALQKARETMRRIGLQEIDEHKKPHELSGGQRQRVAFVRAITPNFSVLFGDEPTGNLDEINSRELMTMLRDNIQQHGRTAIIVTHNIDLALEFGDQIIILTKDNEEKCGQIDPKNIFYRPTNPNANAAAWHTRQAQYNNVQMRPVIEQLIH